MKEMSLARTKQRKICETTTNRPLQIVIVSLGSLKDFGSIYGNNHPTANIPHNKTNDNNKTTKATKTNDWKSLGRSFFEI